MSSSVPVPTYGTMYQFVNKHTLTLDKVREFLSQGYTDAKGKWWQLSCSPERERSSLEVKQLLEANPRISVPDKLTGSSMPIIEGNPVQFRLDFLYFYQVRFDEYLDAIQVPNNKGATTSIIYSIKRDIAQFSYNGKAFFLWWSLAEPLTRVQFASKEEVEAYNRQRDLQISLSFKNSPFAHKHKYNDAHRFSQYKRDAERKFVQRPHKG